MIEVADLKAICPHTPTATLERYAAHLWAAMQEFQITGKPRESAFIAQVAHESGGFRYVKEIASGAEYDIGRKAGNLGNTPEADGDGERYKGRGLIQITGEDNYRDCSTALFGDPDRLLFEPALLERPDIACRSAAWFWYSRGLNMLADIGDFKAITKRINGGLNGYHDRLAYLEKAQQVIV